MKENELGILEQYDINVNSTRKIRGAILCDTNQGPCLLKEIHSPERRVEMLYDLHKYLENQGYKNVDSIIKNKEDGLICVCEDESRYILKRWFYGKECDCMKPQEVLEGVRNLALLHQKMRGGEQKSVQQKESLNQEFARHNREMKKVRTFIRNKVGKGSFELVFLKHFEEMFSWAISASEKLNVSNYQTLLQESCKEGRVAHGDYNYHNILITPTGIATTNFSRFYEGIQVTDFYYFLRKTMEKNQWDVNLGHRMLEQYNRILPFSEDELEYLAICLAYPEKFWKAANSYCRSNKAWISIKSIEKLEIAIKQTNQKAQFLKQLFSFQL